MLLILAAIGIAATVLAHTAPAPFLLEAFHPARSIWHMPADDPPQTVYLTFDDGPNPTATPALLDVLARESAAATFFLIDDHVNEETATLVRRMFAEGHAVGLHSNDRWLMLQDDAALAAILTDAADRIEAIAGRRPCRLFRPHAGWRSAAMYGALDRVSYRLAGWSWGLWDFNWWRDRVADRLAARLGRRANSGDIIVMHDGHHAEPRADRRYTVEATARLIPALRARGLRLATLPCP